MKHILENILMCDELFDAVEDGTVFKGDPVVAYMARQEIFNEIDRRAIEEQRKYMEEVHKLIEGKDRYDAWIILREHGIHVDPYELPENEPPLTGTCRVMSLKEYGIVLAPDELPEEEQIKVLERRKKYCKNYMELKQIDRELNLLKRGRRKNGRFNQQKSIN